MQTLNVVDEQKTVSYLCCLRELAAKQVFWTNEAKEKFIDLWERNPGTEEIRAAVWSMIEIRNAETELMKHPPEVIARLVTESAERDEELPIKRVLLRREERLRNLLPSGLLSPKVFEFSDPRFNARPPAAPPPPNVDEEARVRKAVAVYLRELQAAAATGIVGLPLRNAYCELWHKSLPDGQAENDLLLQMMNIENDDNRDRKWRRISLLLPRGAPLPATF